MTSSNDRCYATLSHLLSAFNLLFGLISFGFVCWGIVVLVNTQEANNPIHPLAQQLFICLAIWVAVGAFKILVDFLKAVANACNGNDSETTSEKSVISELASLAPFAMYIWTWIRYADQEGWNETNEMFPLLTNILFVFAIYATCVYIVAIIGLSVMLSVWFCGNKDNQSVPRSLNTSSYYPAQPASKEPLATI